MDFSVASYSFHRLLAAGKQDMFGYIADCKALGCAYLDPWNGHLKPLIDESNALKAAGSLTATFSEPGLAYVTRVKTAADQAGLPFICLAVDGAHIYEPTVEARQINRASAYRWLDVAQRLGAQQVRVDSGGSETLTDEVFALIVEGYQDVIARARSLGLEVIIENHWGASSVPENVLRMLKAIDGLGLLFDSNNFADGLQEEGWEKLTPYAKSVHIKTFAFNPDGTDPTVDIPRVVRLLRDRGYTGCWGIESMPMDGDEIGGVRKTMALIEQSLAL